MEIAHEVKSIFDFFSDPEKSLVYPMKEIHFIGKSTPSFLFSHVFTVFDQKKLRTLGVFPTYKYNPISRAPQPHVQRS
jgi:hypothetical protein